MHRFAVACSSVFAVACFAVMAGCGGQLNSFPELQTRKAVSAHLRSTITDSGRVVTESSDLAAGDPQSASSETPSDETPHADATQILGDLAQHYVYLTWNRSPSYVLGYNIYRGPSPLGPFNRLNVGVEPATVYTDYAVMAGKMYFYVITAVDGHAESGYSTPVSATVPTP